jgi:hypothetical protein
MDAIKIWEYKEDYSEKMAKISLFNDRVEMLDSYYKTPRVFSFNAIFKLSYPLGNLKVDYELLKYLVIIADKKQLSDASIPVYNFYKNFENNLIEEQCIEVGIKLGNYPYHFYAMTKFGLRSFFERDGHSVDEHKQRFSDFFYHGPKKPNIELNIRQAWRTIVWKAIAKNSEVKLSQAFVLFDYSKIKVLAYEYSNPEKNEGSNLNINQGNVSIGGWSGRDGGGQVYSIEELWYSDSFIYSEFVQHKAEIRKTLQAAIIDQVESNNETINNQEPGEAPPI